MKKYFGCIILLVVPIGAYSQWTSGQAASAVLGQTSFITSASGTTATTLGLNLVTLNLPGLTVDPASGKLFVSDRGNNRVLRYASAATFTNGAAAEFAFGQPNLTSGSANRGGSVAANTLREPEGLWIDNSGNLWVADYSNNRVLRFPNAATTTNFSINADLVLGQPNFTATGGSVSQSQFGERPSGVVGDANNVYVAIQFNHRVLRFSLSGISNGANAAGVLGQPNFTSNTENNGGLTASSMRFPAGLAMDAAGRLFVADFGNNRVLRFNTPATTASPTGGSANAVIGQPNFTTNTPGTAANRMNSPVHISMDGLGNLYVPDFQNSRVLIFANAGTTTSDISAATILGGTAGTSQTQFNLPSGTAVLNNPGRLFVSDRENNRVLRFNAAFALPVELSSFSAKTENGRVVLNWTTASEKNNAGFEVHRLVIGQESSGNPNLQPIARDQWHILGFVKGKGTTSDVQSYSFVDRTASGKVLYRLKQIDFDGQFEILPTIEADAGLPRTFVLEQNYPNPFNPTTSISYQLPVSGQVSLKVFDMLGREVSTLVNESKAAGRYSALFNAASLTSGIYFYRLQAGTFTETKKMTLVK